MSDEYSERQPRAVLGTVDRWYSAFAQCPASLRLTDSQRRKAEAIIYFFARYVYDYLGLTPDEWNPDAVAECCTEILPRKASAELSFFEEIAPVLSTFFRFLEAESLLANGRALAGVVDDLHDAIVSGVEEPGNWGPAKYFIMAAHTAGVDIHDPAALRAYMAKFDPRQTARARSVSGWSSPCSGFEGSPLQAARLHRAVGP